MIIVLIILLLLLQHVVCFTCLPAIRLFIKMWEIFYFLFLAWTMIVVHDVRREAKQLLTCLYQSVDVNLNQKK